jgi:hypothetical protein
MAEKAEVPKATTDILPSTNEAVNKVNDVTKKATDAMTNVASNTTNKVKEELSSAITNTTKILSNPNVLYGLIAIIIVAIICVVLIYYFISKSVFNKKSLVVEKTKFPVKGYITSLLPADVPTSGNGSRRTYTFWIYVNDLNNSSGDIRHVWSIGDKKPNENSPIVYIDSESNKLNISFAKSDNLNNTIDQNYKIKFDYLPLQRWVHIGIVVNDNYSGTTVTLYMDSEIVKSVTNGNTESGSELTANSNDWNTNVDLDKSGSLLVGGDKNGFNGLVSKVTIHNYDLNSKDIYNSYSEGPIDGLLASLGYGVRTPVYKLSD